MNFPWVHVAGDTLDREVSVPDYPSTDGWTLKYRLTPRFATPTQTPIDLTASNNADGTYQLQAGPADTAPWKPGAYGWARWVEKAGARQTLASSNDQGELEVRPDPASSAQGLDTRSHARKVLAQIEAAIESRSLSAQREVLAYTIGSRSQQFDDSETKAEMIKLHSHYKWLVANEDAREAIAAGQPNPRNVGIRFGRG